MISLTAAQQEALDYIESKIADTGVAPSCKEIAKHVGLRAKSGAARLVNGLIARGRLERVPGMARALRVVAPDDGKMYVKPLPEVRLAIERFAAAKHLSVQSVMEDALRAYFVGDAP